MNIERVPYTTSNKDITHVPLLCSPYSYMLAKYERSLLLLQDW